MSLESQSPPSRYLDHLKKTPLARALGAMVVAMGLMPNFVDFPVLSRWDGWAIVFVLAVFLVSGALTTSGRVAWSAAAAAAAAAILVLLFAPLPNVSGKPMADAGRKGQPKEPAQKREELPVILARAVGLDPVATILAFGRQWILRSDGEVIGMNPGGTGPVSFSVRGPATAMVACAGALVITYGNGYVGRFSPTTLRRLAHYHYGYGSGQVICGGGYLWVSKPGKGSVVQLDEHRLELVLEVPLGVEATSIAYGMGAVWAVDAMRGRVVGVDARYHQLLGPFAVMADARQILVAAGYVWVLHPMQSCLLRLDVHRDREVGPGIALGTLPAQMRLREGAIFVTDYSDDTIIEVDVETLQTTRPLQIPDAGRLTDIDVRRGGLVLLDRARGKLLTVDLAAQATLRNTSKVEAERSPDCPKL